MQFSNGAWTMAAGVTPIYPLRVEAIDQQADRLIAHVISVADTHRGASVGAHMFTVTLFSPLAGVIGVRVEHYRGRQRRQPSFHLADHKPSVTISAGTQEWSLASGDLTVALNCVGGAWGLRFRDARGPVTESPLKALGLMFKDGRTYLREQLTLEAAENVYGLGERFTPLVRNGQSVEMWNDDCGTCSDKAYKNIPFYLSNRGYGVLVNTPDRVSFECGTEHTTRVAFSVEDEDLEYFVIGGRDPKLVLRRLCELTGKPALPPAWSFGLWLSTSFTTNYDEKTVTEQIAGMAARELPLHVFHFDPFWMKECHWVDFTWDPQTFPDPAGMLQRLKAQGLKICVWINPYIAERSCLFDEGRERGYLLKRPNGDVYQRDEWQPNMGLVDFTNPDAYRWFQEKLRPLTRMGVDTFKTDFGERIPTDVVYHDGSDPRRMHNYYTLLYNRAVFELLEQERGRGDACVFARSATVGSNQFPLHWGGDCRATFSSMAETLRGGLSLALCGFGFWSHDIGGFEDKAEPDLYKRWVAFGLLSSHSRLHGSSSYRVPWAYDEEAVGVLRFFTQLKCRLMPYLYAQAVIAHTTGVPMLRPMLLEFPDDPACASLDRQYMLGDSLLVAPVFSPTGEVSYYLPEGTWTNLLTGERRQGGRWYQERHDVFSLPLWLRPNRVLPLGAELGQVEYDYARGLELVVGAFEPGASAEFDLVDSHGAPLATIRAHREGAELLCERRFNSEQPVRQVWKLVAPQPPGSRASRPPPLEMRSLPPGPRHVFDAASFRAPYP